MYNYYCSWSLCCANHIFLVDLNLYCLSHLYHRNESRRFIPIHSACISKCSPTISMGLLHSVTFGFVKSGYTKFEVHLYSSLSNIASEHTLLSITAYIYLASASLLTPSHFSTIFCLPRVFHAI